MYYWNATTSVKIFDLVEWRGKHCMIRKIDHKIGKATLVPYIRKIFGLGVKHDTYEVIVPMREMRKLPY